MKSTQSSTYPESYRLRCDRFDFVEPKKSIWTVSVRTVLTRQSSRRCCRCPISEGSVDRSCQRSRRACSVLTVAVRMQYPISDVQAQSESVRQLHGWLQRWCRRCVPSSRWRCRCYHECFSAWLVNRVFHDERFTAVFDHVEQTRDDLHYLTMR